MHFSAPIPVLRIFSEAKAKEYYVGFLGFGVDWEHRFGDNFPLYAQVSRDGLVLHLSEHHGDATPGSMLIVPVDDIDALHAQLRATDYTYAKPGIKDLPWARVMEITDPFGNRIRFSADKATRQPVHRPPSQVGQPGQAGKADQ